MGIIFTHSTLPARLASPTTGDGKPVGRGPPVHYISCILSVGERWREWDVPGDGGALSDSDGRAKSSTARATSSEAIPVSYASLYVGAVTNETLCFDTLWRATERTRRPALTIPLPMLPYIA